jgi:hypothetical protein
MSSGALTERTKAENSGEDYKQVFAAVLIYPFI